VSTTELVANGKFSADTDWTDYDNGTSGGSTVITGGQLKITQGSNSVWMGASQTFSIVSGASYRIKGRYTGGSGHGKIYVGSSQGATTYFDSGTLAGNAAGGNAHDLVFIASATGTAHLTLIDGQAATNIGYWDDVSVKQDDLVLNGTMELDDNWNDVGSPTTNERSTTQVYAGTYSRKCVADATSTGLQSDTFSVVAGETYEVSFYYYLEIAAGPTYRWIMKIKDGDGSDLGSSYSLAVTGAWTNITFYTTATATGSGSYFQAFQSGAGDSTLYLDNVSVKQVNGNPGTLVNTPTFSTDIP